MTTAQASEAPARGSNRHAEPVTLRALRLQHELSLRDLEAVTGIHRGRLSELERGIRWPKTAELEELEEFFDVPGLAVAFVIVVAEEAA